MHIFYCNTFPTLYASWISSNVNLANCQSLETDVIEKTDASGTEDYSMDPHSSSCSTSLQVLSLRPKKSKLRIVLLFFWQVLVLKCWWWNLFSSAFFICWSVVTRLFHLLRGDIPRCFVKFPHLTSKLSFHFPLNFNVLVLSESRLSFLFLFYMAFVLLFT